MIDMASSSGFLRESSSSFSLLNGLYRFATVFQPTEMNAAIKKRNIGFLYEHEVQGRCRQIHYYFNVALARDGRTPNQSVKLKFIFIVE